MIDAVQAHVHKSISTLAVAIGALICATTVVEANEVGQETSDRTPVKGTIVPLSQVDSVKGQTSDRTPGPAAAEVPETSDRTPSKHTPTPAVQADKFRDETSDRTPSDS